MPLYEQDVSGFDFSGSDLRNTGIDQALNLRRAKFEGAIFDANVPSLDPQVIAFNRSLKGMSPTERNSTIAKAVEAFTGIYDVVTFTTAIKRARSASEAQDFFDLLSKTHVKPNIYVFSAMLLHINSQKELRSWYDAMLAAGEKPDVTTFTTLINKAETEALARGWYDAMLAAGEKPDSYTHYHGVRLEIEAEQTASQFLTY